MSHTVRLKVQLQDKDALGLSVLELRGMLLGEGTYKLYQNSETGFGFTLPNWNLPLVLKENGELAFDDFNGYWGDKADIDRLTERYTIAVAKSTAEAQGWLTESSGGGLIIYHPDGGTLTVRPNGTVDAENFVGGACTSASAAIEAALGTRQEQNLKSDYFAERAHVRAAN